MANLGFSFIHPDAVIPMKAREGESRESWFRCNRFYNLKGKWFFSTREGIDFGPYETQQEARHELENFISRYQQALARRS